MKTTDWTDMLDAKVLAALRQGRVSGQIKGQPDDIIESGLAHIFFYGDTVYKLYKTHSDKDHFIKGVLAPTHERIAFLEHDFAVNRHFSQQVYKNLHSLRLVGEQVEVGPYQPGTIYVLVEMSRLDFDTNLHERLLRGDIDEGELALLGHETARSIATCPIQAPDQMNWYELAKERVGFLRQFVDWLPTEFATPLQEAEVIAALEAHLERHREEYEAIRGEHLTVNIDNHDENVFFIEGKPQFIDLLPPMRCWWYGVPYANLANLMANIEALHSDAAAQKVREGYLAYHGGEAPPAHIFGFTRAFAYLISIAHFGSVPEKAAVTQRYLARVEEIPSWLEIERT